MTSKERPRHYGSVEECVEDLLAQIGPSIRMGLPLGLGKPNQLVNELLRRVAGDASLSLDILTALSPEPPTFSSELERRLIEPIRQRLYGGWPELDYVSLRRRRQLPSNVRVIEFYYPPGRLLANPAAQSDYTSSNYSQVVDDLRRGGLDLLAQIVAPDPNTAAASPARRRYSLSSNPDLTLDLLPLFAEWRERGLGVAVVAQVNRELPYMRGDAEVEGSAFDAVLDDPALDFPLFGVPHRPLGTTDWLVGLWASTLVRDGGTVQLGIGTLNDGVCQMLIQRHRQSDAYRELLARADPVDRARATEIGGEGPFERGLFANSEMLVEGLLALYHAGILKRRVYPDADLQRAIDGRGSTEVDADLLAKLVELEAIPEELDGATVGRLQELGVLHSEVRFAESRLHRPGAVPVPARVGSPAERAALASGFLSPALRGGEVAHAGFFFGSEGFYRDLRELSPEARRELAMTRISWTNRLGDDFRLKEAQRIHARFLNETMMMTALGAAVSDALEDGRVVSGVGGQHDFVVMAHRLRGARSILMLPSTRDDGSRLRSNIRWSYGHVTIPRHLRDLVVTEYGVADLRGKTDREVVEAMLRITDARFQDDIAEQARAAGKLPRDYRLPDRCRDNRPERLEEILGPHRERGLYPAFPFGSELEREEVELGRSLRSLRGRRWLKPSWLVGLADSLRRTLQAPAAARPYLERMGLERPRGLSERLQRRAVLLALARSGVI